MRLRFILAAGFVAVGTAALAQTAVQVWTPLGYQQITPVPTKTALTVPTGTRMANICVSGVNVIRYRDDGTAPTTTVGMAVSPAYCFIYSGNLNAIQFIQVTSPATLDVSYYR